MRKIFTLRNITLVAIGFSGMAALIYEVVWTRMLTLIFGSTVYAVSTMLCAFMAGLALGSYLMARKIDKIKDLGMYFGLMELGIGIYGILFLLFFGYLQFPYFWLYQLLHNYFWFFVFAQFLLYFLVLLIPTTLFGAIFPVATKIFIKGMEEAGKDVGYIYSANSLGSVIGPFLAGFILIPLIGVSKTAILAAVINIFLALVILRFSVLRSDVKFFLPFVLIFLLLGLYAQIPPMLLNEWIVGAYPSIAAAREDLRDLQILFYKEGPYSNVSVVQIPKGPLGLKSDGRGEASLLPEDMKHQLLLAYIPMLLHKNPEKVLNIGFGAGFTSGAMGNFEEAKQIDSVEIDPIVLEASKKFFSRFNNDILNDPRFRIFVTDGRNYLLMTKEKYDVINSASSHPVSSAVSHLFTKEFFELAKSRLAEGGIYSQWVPGFKFSLEEHKIVTKTFTSVFPYTTLWIDSFWALGEPRLSVNSYLIGSLKPIEIDAERIIGKINATEKIKKDLEFIAMDSPEKFLKLKIFDNQQVLNFVRDEKRLNTDDWPIIEFRAPKALLEGSFVTLADLIHAQ